YPHGRSGMVPVQGAERDTRVREERAVGTRAVQRARARWHTARQPAADHGTASSARDDDHHAVDDDYHDGEQGRPVARRKNLAPLCPVLVADDRVHFANRGRTRGGGAEGSRQRARLSPSRSAVREGWDDWAPAAGSRPTGRAK